jgi:hypothetical protein
MTVDQLLSQLYRPIYVLQMARALEDAPGPHGVGARKRAHNARCEIHDLILSYQSDRHAHESLGGSQAPLAAGESGGHGYPRQPDASARPENTFQGPTMTRTLT